MLITCDKYNQLDVSADSDTSRSFNGAAECGWIDWSITIWYHIYELIFK